MHNYKLTVKVKIYFKHVQVGNDQEMAQSDKRFIGFCRYVAACVTVYAIACVLRNKITCLIKLEEVVRSVTRSSSPNCAQRQDTGQVVLCIGV